MSDELDFESMMAAQGVQRIGKGTSRKAAPRASIPMGAPVVSSAVVRASELTAVQQERDAAQARVTELSRQVQSRDGTIKSLRAQLAAANEQAEQEGIAQASKHAARADELVAAQERIAGLTAALSGATAALDQSNAAKTSLADALVERGCTDAVEMMAVLNGLLLQRPREFLDSLVLADPHALAQVLVDRVAFVSKGVDFTPDKNTVVVRVPKARCEICSGSDIAANFHGFVQACIDRDIGVVTVVGGSPAYRRQLSELADGNEDAPRMNLVSGTRRRETRKAKSDMRSSDVVVIWGGTELDHSVAELYRGDGARIVRVSHRGIAGMLALVRGALRGSVKPSP